MARRLSEIIVDAIEANNKHGIVSSDELTERLKTLVAQHAIGVEFSNMSKTIKTAMNDLEGRLAEFDQEFAEGCDRRAALFQELDALTKNETFEL